MKNHCKNQFVFKGEVAELVNQKSSINAKIICKLGTLLVEIQDLSGFELGDQVTVTGNFTCEKIENINNINANH